MAETTTIEVSKDNWQLLNRRKEPGDSFNDVISRLLGDDEHPQPTPNARADHADNQDESQLLEDLLETDVVQDVPDLDDVVEQTARNWQSSIDERTQAARAALQWLQQDGGPASASDIQDALLPENSVANQNQQTWWKKTVRPVLKSAVDAGLIEYRKGHHDYTWTGPD